MEIDVKEALLRLEVKIDRVLEKVEESHLLSKTNSLQIERFRGGLILFSVLGSILGVLSAFRWLL